LARQAYAPSSLHRWLDRTAIPRRLVWVIEAGALWLAWALLRRLGPDRAARLGNAVLRAAGPHLRKSRHVLANLARAFPELGEAELDALVRNVWGSTGAMLADFANLDAICAREARERIEVVVKEDLRVFAQSECPAVFATAHFDNFQLATVAAACLGAPMTALYTPDSNPLIDRMIRRRRRAIACGLVPRDGGMRALVGELRSGRSVGLVVDTRIDGGVSVPFFGVEAQTSTAPARLALRFGCELVPMRVERIADARFRVTFHGPVTSDDPALGPKENALVMTRKLNAHFEAWIRERPGQWLCLKRRWPKDAA
jgi:Kdo2-lipid IVA lauroyltransferase/acyltransferase